MWDYEQTNEPNANMHCVSVYLCICAGIWLAQGLEQHSCSLAWKCETLCATWYICPCCYCRCGKILMLTTVRTNCVATFLETKMGLITIRVIWRILHNGTATLLTDGSLSAEEEHSKRINNSACELTLIAPSTRFARRLEWLSNFQWP